MDAKSIYDWSSEATNALASRCNFSMLTLRKPQKPLRPLRVYGDENNLPKAFPQKTLHSRNKSSPSLSTLASAGVGNVASKRSAFGDLSNTFHRNRRLVKDDMSVIAKPLSKEEDKPAGAFLRPAQRPLRDVSNVAKATTQITSTVSLINKPQIAPTRKAPLVETAPADVNIATVKNEDAPTSQAPTRNSWNTDLQNKSVEIVEQHSDVKQPQKPEEIPALPENLVERVSEVHLTSALPETQSELSTGVQQVPIPPPAADYIPSSNVPTNTYSKETEILVEAIRKTSIAAVEPIVEHSVPTIEPVQEVQTYEPIVQSSISGVASIKTGLSSHETEHYWEEDDDLENYEDEGYVTARSIRSRADNITGNATTTLVPRDSFKARHEIAAATELVESLKTIEDYEDEVADTSMVAEYGEEIFEYLREMEEKMQPNPHYMDYQTEIQWSMRAVLMDWIVQVHTRFNLLPETLFLTANYIDRFLSAKIVSLNKLQLVGATALFVAAKYEEINCPSVSEIVYMVDNGYSVDEVLKAERFMLSMLQFELGWPGPMSFLRRISKADDYDLETRTVAKYLLEVTIMDERFLGCPPSFTAAGAHCLARQLLNKGHWSPAHVHYSNYTYSQLLPLVQLIHECCTDPFKHHAAVYDKYQDKRYKSASRYVKQEIQRGFRVQEVGAQLIAPVLSYFDHVQWVPEYVHLPWQ